jgi:hypothetical protein
MALVKNTVARNKNEDYDFNKMCEIFNAIKGSYKIENEAMPQLWHYDATTSIIKDGIQKAKYAIEIKQRNQPFDEFKKFGTYFLTVDKLNNLQQHTKEFDKCLYLVLHLGKWVLFDLRKIDWSKVRTKMIWQKERELDEDSPYVFKKTYLIPQELVFKTGFYEIGNEP